MRHETDGSRRQRADDLSPRIPDDGGIRGFHGGGHRPRHAVTFALGHSRPNGVFDRDNPMIEALPQFEDLVAEEFGQATAPIGPWSTRVPRAASPRPPSSITEELLPPLGPACFVPRAGHYLRIHH